MEKEQIKSLLEIIDQQVSSSILGAFCKYDRKRAGLPAGTAQGITLFFCVQQNGQLYTRGIRPVAPGMIGPPLHNNIPCFQQ
eukprot:gene23485-27966_t